MSGRSLAVVTKLHLIGLMRQPGAKTTLGLHLEWLPFVYGWIRKETIITTH